jgi:hypothetical protein
MTLQNRVLPTGEIVAIPLRGDFMGNRGILHDDNRQLGASRWKLQGWVTCRLSFRGRRRELMHPGRYTELFFFDEAVALAAGHRPCAKCRRDDYNAYRAAWTRAHGEMPLADADRMLHKARVSRDRRQVTHKADAARLPSGTFIMLDGDSWLVRDHDILRFTTKGYGDSRPKPEGKVIVLTPAPTVATIAAGYRPALHESAGG